MNLNPAILPEGPSQPRQQIFTTMFPPSKVLRKTPKKKLDAPLFPLFLKNPLFRDVQ